MRSDQIAAVLSKTGFFARLDDATRAEVATRMIPRRYERNEIIFHRGDPGSSFYVVAEGRLKVFLTSEDGHEMVLTTLETHDVFGELALLDGGPRSASVRVMEHSLLLATSRDAFLELIEHNPVLARSLFESLGALLRRNLDQASDLVFLDLPGRIAKLLVELAERAGTHGADETEIDPHISQGNLAAMVGGSRPSFNQILHAFQDRGYIQIRGRKLVVKDIDALRRRAGI
jgi:CRP/FNR family transcriptional regulator, cyclic AMP receptor protein